MKPNRYERAVKLARALAKLPDEVNFNGTNLIVKIDQGRVRFYRNSRVRHESQGSDTLESINNALEWIAEQKAMSNAAEI